MITTLGKPGSFRNTIEKAHKVGELIRIAPGFYETSETWNGLYPSERFAHTAIARASTNRQGILTGLAAAAVLGFPVDTNKNTPIHFLTSGASFSRKTNIRRFRTREAELDRAHLHTVDDQEMQIASPQDIIAHIARYDTIDNAVKVLDHCLYNKLITKEDLKEVAAELHGKKNVHLIRDTITLGNYRIESPRETDTKLGLLRAGYRGFKAQLEFILVGWHKGIRVDLGFDTELVGLEYDGKKKSVGINDQDTARRALEDKERHYACTSNGIQLIRISNESFQTGLYLDQLDDALKRSTGIMPRGVTILGGEPVVAPTGWK